MAESNFMEGVKKVRARLSRRRPEMAVGYVRPLRRGSRRDQCPPIAADLLQRPPRQPCPNLDSSLAWHGSWRVKFLIFTNEVVRTERCRPSAAAQIGGLAHGPAISEMNPPVYHASLSLGRGVPCSSES